MKARVYKSTGSWYLLETEPGRFEEGRIRGKLKLQNLKVTNPIAVGDYVEVQRDKDTDDLVITEICRRENYIIRKSTHKTGHAHIIASNIDLAALVVTLAMPRTSVGFIDRYLVNCESFRIPAALFFNKTDLYDHHQKGQLQALGELYAGLGYKVIYLSAKNGEGVDEVEQLLKNKTTLISGHSGVGKSTLLNRISIDIEQRTAEVSNFANKGVHTTTFAEMFKLGKQTEVIDTPGIKELGLIEMEPEEISHYFPEMRELLGQCRFHNCMHLHEPGCVVKEAVDNKNIDSGRYKSYISMVEDEDNRK